MDIQTTVSSQTANLDSNIGSDNTLSTTHAEISVFIALLSFLSVMGTAGNALVLYVFIQKRDRLTSTLFILALACVDFMTCLIIIPYTIYMEYVGFYVNYDLTCKMYQFLITSNIPFSALIMVAIAVDRYFCICHPFLHAINLRRAKLMILGLALVACCLGVVVALMFGVYHRPKGQDVDRLQEHYTNKSRFEDGVMTSNQTMDWVSYLGQSENDTSLEVTIIFTGWCDVNDIYLSESFAWYYQKFYAATYLVCLIIVIILYILIYRSVMTRRSKRQKQKSASLPLVMTSQATNGNTTVSVVTTEDKGAEVEEAVNGNKTVDTAAVYTGHDIQTKTLQVPAATGSAGSSGGKTAKEKSTRRKEKRQKTAKDRNRIANLKTAAMLFVVTVVFIVSYMPSLLMTIQVLPYNTIIFYMYFTNNVANPVIYSFMNANFRDDLKKIFCH